MNMYNRKLLGNLVAQKGMATILMVLLVSVSIAAMSTAILLSVRSSQDKQVAAQAQINAQAAVWTQAEFFRRYFASLSSADVAALAVSVNGGNKDIQELVLPDDGNVAFTANFVDFQTPATGNPTATLELTAVDKAARASSSIQVAYELIPSTGETATLHGGLNFNRGLKTEGGIHFTPQTGRGLRGEAVLNIKGSAELTAVLEGVDTVKASGNIVLGSDTTRVREAYANGDIILKAASAVWGTAKAKGSIDTSEASGCFIGKAYANLDIFYKCDRPTTAPSYQTKDAAGNVTTVVVDTSKVTEINARRDVTITASAIGFTRVVAGNTASVTTTQAAACPTCVIETLEAGGLASGTPSISISSNARIVQNIKTTGTMTCPVGTNMASGFGANLINATASVFTECPVDPKFTQSTTAVVSTLIQPIGDIDLEPYEVDVWKDTANYVVSAVGNVVHVKVIGVVGNSASRPSLDGDYILGKRTSASPVAYLCPPDGSACTAGIQFCKGDPNACLTVQGDTFTLDNTLVPGVIFFQGNLLIKGTAGTTATILASGNIKSENAIQISALNYAGKSGFAQGAFGSIKPVYGVCDNLAPDFTAIPLAYCPLPDATATPPETGFKSFPLGNVALKAGGRKPGGAVDAEDTNRLTYGGGDIWLAANSAVLGTILSGNFFRSEGTVLVKGYLSASGLRREGIAGGNFALAGNQLTASTNVDVSNLPSTFKPEVVEETTSSNSGEGSAQEVKIIGTRYR